MKKKQQLKAGQLEQLGRGYWTLEEREREREMMMMMFNTSEDMCMSIGVMASYCFFDDMFSVSECRFLFQIRFFNL